MKTVLITGATGFLGKYTVNEFLTNGYKVIALGRNIDALRSLEGKNVQTVRCDLGSLRTLKVDADYIVHVAALSTVWGTWGEFFENNVEGTKHVINYCVRNHIKRLVFVSSPSIYSGKEDRYNIAESDYDSSNSLNNYIKSKIAAEQLVHNAQSKKLETVIIRPRGLFGIGDTSIIPRLLKANDRIGVPLFNNGHNLVDITCVENVAYSLRLAVESSKANGKTYNITNGEPREFQSILETLFKRIGKKPRYLHIDLSLMYNAACMIEQIYKLLHIKREPPFTKYTICTLGYSQTLDISSAIKDLGYTPPLSLDEGIKKYAKNYKKQN